MCSVLVVTSINLYRNSSVCLANIAYLNGLLNNDFDVTVVMPSIDEADKDPAMKLPGEVRYLVYDRTSPIEQRIAKAVKTTDLDESIRNNPIYAYKQNIRRFLSKQKQKFLKKGKKKEFFINDKYFIRSVRQHLEEIGSQRYEYVISISSPVSSHYVAEQIINTGMIKYNKWIQIWEDPWYYDLYTEKDKDIFNEEHRLLLLADSIVYVSPITYEYQMKCFNDCANKMSWAFLPCYKEVKYKHNNRHEELIIGYFGEYFSSVRNIVPIAKAVHMCEKVRLIVCGNGDIELKKYNNVTSYGRVDIAKVEELQEKCDVLINISNLKGGQIPGKVYQYAGTNKPILFILDGQGKEIDTLINIFGKYNRFIFCENNERKIVDCLNNIYEKIAETNETPVEDFSGEQIIRKIMKSI